MNRGFAPVLIAIGIVSILAAMSLTSSMAAGIANSKQIKRLNRIEGFYTGELAAWHYALRTQQGLNGVESAGRGGYTLKIDNRYVESLDWLTPDSYDPTPGIAMNVATTRDFAPTKSMIRRYSDTAVRYLADNPTSFCGRMQFGKRNVGICLAGGISKPKLIQPWIKASSSMACAHLPDIGVQCWGKNAEGYLDQNEVMGRNVLSPTWMPDLKEASQGKTLSFENSPSQCHFSAHKKGISIGWGGAILNRARAKFRY